MRGGAKFYLRSCRALCEFVAVSDAVFQKSDDALFDVLRYVWEGRHTRAGDAFVYCSSQHGLARSIVQGLILIE